MPTTRDVHTFRSQGPRGLEAWLKIHGGAAAPELDAVCRQKDAHTARLYWFTDLPAAIAEAKRTGRPILSLRLLGNLDEELSCANSRFFRKLLYPHPGVNQMLREDFVLHWQSVREVPVVTIDFGGGKRLVRTLTGNSVHLVLDSSGRPVDALPGLMRPEVFARELETAHQLARSDRRQLTGLHGRQLMNAPAPQPAEPSRAFRASAMAMSKHLVEAPILRAVTSPIDADTEQNLALRQRVHQAFAEGAMWNGLEGFVEWIYAELFAMPLHDPALGLDVPDPFSSLEAAPRRASRLASLSPHGAPPMPPMPQPVAPMPPRRAAASPQMAPMSSMAPISSTASTAAR